MEQLTTEIVVIELYLKSKSQEELGYSYTLF